jgi:VIT1/CCC1 family predicted Fe2+/Mn2+ transporter
MPGKELQRRLTRLEWPLFNVLSPSVSLAELVYGLVTALAVTNTLRYAFEGQPNANFLIVMAALGANLAWGIADGFIYLLSSTVENRRVYSDAKELRQFDDETARSTILADLSGTMVHTLEDHEKKIIVDTVHSSLKRSNLHHVHLKKVDYVGAVACVLLSLTAALPIILPHLFTTDAVFANLVGNIIGLIIMFILGVIWARMVKEPLVKSGLIMFSIGLIILTVVILFGG